ncbi:hypothetical protein [Paragemmobacter straminiformis]|uniref:Uncharacterized protein n=1 Tax=Paragemmobacter straminiformis TaxID=2045119 RepID=A0A842IA96_9RHOB|nr:hypothetical protein [Gemmobacter straminiformis]MBC2836519.1 hypothetical protein [Gemmobacter straminiformis]
MSDENEIEDDPSEELEEGQDICPVCRTLVWPGAMDYCQHYLWTRWDGQIIWPSSEAEGLLRIANDFVASVYDAEEGGWAALAYVALRDGGSPEAAEFVAQGYSLSTEDVADAPDTKIGKWRETDGMLSGSGVACFAPIAAAAWAERRSVALKTALAVIGKQRPNID